MLHKALYKCWDDGFEVVFWDTSSLKVSSRHSSVSCIIVRLFLSCTFFSSISHNLMGANALNICFIPLAYELWAWTTCFVPSHSFYVFFFFGYCSFCGVGRGCMRAHVFPDLIFMTVDIIKHTHKGILPTWWRRHYFLCFSCHLGWYRSHQMKASLLNIDANCRRTIMDANGRARF